MYSLVSFDSHRTTSTVRMENVSIIQRHRCLVSSCPFTLCPKPPLICILSLEIRFCRFEKFIKMKSYGVSYLASLSPHSVVSPSASWWTFVLCSLGQSETVRSRHAQIFSRTYMFSFLFGKYLGVELLAHTVSICLILWETVPGHFWQSLVPCSYFQYFLLLV